MTNLLRARRHDGPFVKFVSANSLHPIYSLRKIATVYNSGILRGYKKLRSPIHVRP
jgi:hypothetical protein